MHAERKALEKLLKKRGLSPAEARRCLAIVREAPAAWLARPEDLLLTVLGVFEKHKEEALGLSAATAGAMAAASVALGRLTVQSVPAERQAALGLAAAFAAGLLTGVVLHSTGAGLLAWWRTRRIPALESDDEDEED